MTPEDIKELRDVLAKARCITDTAARYAHFRDVLGRARRGGPPAISVEASDGSIYTQLKLQGREAVDFIGIVLAFLETEEAYQAGLLDELHYTTKQENEEDAN